MKSLFVISTLMLSFTHVQAEPAHLTSADGSDLSALCIAAAHSDRPLIETAQTYGIKSYEISEISCNGIRLDRFADKYKALSTAAPKPLVFKKSDESELTELCYRALSSFDEYQQLLRQRVAKDAKLQAELTCNGMPVMDFVSRYRNRAEVSATSLQ